MSIPLAVGGSTNTASQVSADTGMLWLLLLIFGSGAVLLFTAVLAMSVMRLSRARWARQRDGLAIPPRPKITDAWAESADRMPTDTDAPREPNPDEDLPPMGGRFR